MRNGWIRYVQTLNDPDRTLAPFISDLTGGSLRQVDRYEAPLMTSFYSILLGNNLELSRSLWDRQEA